MKAIVPPLYISSEGVKREDNKFEAHRFNLGVLGLVLLNYEHANYNNDGKLVYYLQAKAILTGLLWSSANWKEMKANKLSESKSWSVLWGCFGHSTQLDETKKMKILWIPIKY